MLDILAGVPGRLKVLIDRLSVTWAAKVDTLHDTRLTAARAGYLDNLSAGTPPLRTAYSDARGAFLDNLNVGGLVASAAGLASVSIINRIQFVQIGLGSGVVTGNATITAVVVAKTIIIPAGEESDNVNPPDNFSANNVRWSIVNTTTVNARRGRDQGIITGANAFVVEFK